jgi:tetratricopeptide (TPR) repeat protein
MDIIQEYENKKATFNENELLAGLRIKGERGASRVYSLLKILGNYPQILESNLAFRFNFMIATNYYIAHKYEEALEYYHKTLENKPYFDDDQKSGDIYNFLGQIYKDLGELEKSLHYYNISIKLFRDIEDWDSYIGVSLNLISVYHTLNQYDIEENMLNDLKSLILKHDVSHQTRAMFHSTFGLFLKRKNKLNLAEIEFRTILDINDDFEMKINFITSAIGNLASTLFALKREHEAFDLIIQGINLAKEYNLIEKEAFFNILTAENLVRKVDYKTAVQHLLEAKDLCLKKYNKRYLLHIYKMLSSCFINLGDTEKCGEYFTKFSKTQEELFSEGAKTKIAEVEKEFSLYKERKEKELYQLKNVELVDSMAKLEESYKSLEDSQEKIIELERKNATLAAAVTANHEINQPLMIIQGEVELLKMKLEDELDSSLIKRFERIGNSINRISDILDKLTNVTEIEYKDYSEQTKMLDLD